MSPKGGSLNVTCPSTLGGRLFDILANQSGCKLRVLWGIAHTCITLLYLPSDFIKWEIDHHNGNYVRHLLFWNIKNVRAVYYSFRTSPEVYKAFFHSGVYCDKRNSSTLRNCLLLRPPCTFYITLICTCLPCGVVKNGKIIQFGDIRMKHLRLLYVRLWLILSPLLLTVEQVAQCDKRRLLAMRGIGRSSPSSDRWTFFLFFFIVFSFPVKKPFADETLSIE